MMCASCTKLQAHKCYFYITVLFHVCNYFQYFVILIKKRKKKEMVGEICDVIAAIS